MAAAKKAATKTAAKPAAPAAKPRGRPPGKKKDAVPEQQMSVQFPDVPVTAPGKPVPWDVPTGQPHHTAHNQTSPTVDTAAPSPPGVPGIAPVNDPHWLTRLFEWSQLKARIDAEMKPLVEQEQEMRRALSAAFFPDPREGTNNVPLPEGWTLKYVHTLTRTYDEAAWAAVFAQLPPGSNEYLIQWKPFLKLENYRNLDDASKFLLEQCLSTKPGSPTLVLVPPKAE